MHAFFIGPPAHQLYACLHAPVVPMRGVAALVLGSWGREVHRSHRLMRALAERLAMQGVPALRFDWQGSGDSAGDDTAALLATWCGDAARAHAELLTRTGATRAVWIGLRLGATVALQADHRLARDLVLFDPVLDGPALLADWQQAHDAHLATSYTPGNPASAQVLAAPSGPTHGEVMGFAVSAAFAAELAALHPADLAPPPGARVCLIHGEAPAGLAAWKAAHGAPAQETPVAQSLPWLAAEGSGTPLVPAPAVNAVLAAVRALAP